MMQLEDINYYIHDNKISFLTYKFNINEDEKSNIKEKIKKQMQEFEEMIEEEYETETYQKKETSTFQPNNIEAGFQYTQENVDIEKIFRSNITYILEQNHNGIECKIRIHTTGNQEKIINFYEKIKQKNFEKIKYVENDINDLDFILNEGYKKQKYPGLKE